MSELAPIKGLVLAGGQSSRMGEDKAALEIAGVTLLERAVQLLQAQLDDVYVSVRSSQRHDSLRSRFNLIGDSYEDCGPAAGILAAHQAFPDCAWFVVACDMPLLDQNVIAGVIEARAADTGATACLAGDNSGPEPLCALYEPVNLAAFLQHVDEGGSPGPRAWLESRPITLLQMHSPERLAGVNTQEEFHRIAGQLDTGRATND
jgi:molybdopterin-guanine dinucleotide biosynthesis protein A